LISYLSMSNLLTIKQRKFIQAIPSSKSLSEAAVRAGYSYKSARYIASENLTKPYIRRAMTAVLDKAGLTDEKIAGSLLKIIDAGVMQEATALDSLRGIDIVLRLQGK